MYKIKIHVSYDKRFCHTILPIHNTEVYAVLFIALLIKNMLKTITTKKVINVDEVTHKIIDKLDLSESTNNIFKFETGQIDINLYLNLVKNNILSNLSSLSYGIMYYRNDIEPIFDILLNYARSRPFEDIDEDTILEKEVLTICTEDEYISFLLLDSIDDTISEYKKLEEDFVHDYNNTLDKIFIKIHDYILDISDNEIKPYFEYHARKLVPNDLQNRKLSIYNIPKYQEHLFIETGMSLTQQYYLLKKITQNLDKEIILIRIPYINFYKYYQYVTKQKIPLYEYAQNILEELLDVFLDLSVITDQFCNRITSVFIIPDNSINLNYLEYQKEVKSLSMYGFRIITSKYIYQQFFDLIYKLFSNDDKFFTKIIKTFYYTLLKDFERDTDEKTYIDEVIPPKIIFETFDILYDVFTNLNFGDDKMLKKVFLNKDSEYIKSILTTIFV